MLGDLNGTTLKKYYNVILIINGDDTSLEMRMVNIYNQECVFPDVERNETSKFVYLYRTANKRIVYDDYEVDTEGINRTRKGVPLFE